MSDKFTNPFLTPPVQKPNELQAPSHQQPPQQPHVNQQQAPIGQAPIGQPDQPSQMPQNPVSGPVSNPIVAPSSNPFTMAPQTPAASQTPTQVSTQMPAQTPAQIPVQAPVLSPETAGGQPSLGHAASPASTLHLPHARNQLVVSNASPAALRLLLHAICKLPNRQVAEAVNTPARRPL